MQAEQIEIIDFLRRHPPFTELPEDILTRVASEVEITYYKAGTKIMEVGDITNDWHIIRSGSVEVYRRNGVLYNRLSEGGFFGEFALLRNNKRVRFPVTALEDTLMYLIPEAIFTDLFETYDGFADIVELEDRTRLRHAVARYEDANELMSLRVEELVSRVPVCIAITATVREAAIRMTDEGVSSLLIQASDEDSDTPTILGIVTDRDIRSRLVALGLDYDTPISDIMTADLIKVEHNQLIFEAMLEMLRFNVHRLPVIKHGKAIGIVALSDIIRYESQNSLFVVSSIYRAQSVEDLVDLKQDVRASFQRMVNEGANSRMIGGAMAQIGSSFKQRLLELAEETLGAPPVPYCFLAMGSMAREEQLIVTDQDNALILDNRYDPVLHGEYFEKLAMFVCDGLAACGYAPCTGNIMATNPKWRQPFYVWENYFSDWIDNPTPESLLNSSIFFDLEGVYGETRWADMLNDLIRRKAMRASRFLACIARNALLRTPPLGFFKDFVMETDGRHTNSINMKRRGTAPLSDLIRVHALAVGSKARNSFERLNDIEEANILPPGRCLDLRDTLELISMVRIRHQALDLEAEREPDNNVEPENLSELERQHLKDAFQILSNAQKYLKFRYQPGRM
jgi:CBS domain-containing protein